MSTVSCTHILANTYHYLTHYIPVRGYKMIDLSDQIIEVEHKPFGASRRIRRDGKLGKTKWYSKKIFINKVPVLVTSLNNGTQINIRCCPLKVLQGHNVFGTNNVVMLGNKIIVDVLKELGIKASEGQLRAWRKGEFRIDEIHLTHRFQLESNSMVRRVVSHIHRYARRSLRAAYIDSGVGVTLKGPHLEWLFYDKCLEFGDKRTKEQKYIQAVVGDRAESAGHCLHQLASKSIRAELKLDKDYLQDDGLDRGKNWTTEKVIEIFTKELGVLRLGEMPSLPQLPEIYASVADVKLRDVLMLWGSGKDMSTHVGKTTRERHRREIKKLLGIDILKDQPALEPASINLSDIFDPSNMLTGFPKWARKYPELALR